MTCRIMQLSMYNIDLLNDARLERGWPTLKLATVSGVPESTVRGILTKGSGHPENIEKIARALGFTLKDLLPGNRKKRA